MQAQMPSRRFGLDTIYRNERGVVLIIVLTLLPIIAMLGATAVMTTITDVQIGANYKTDTQALAVAQAGLAEARARMVGSASDATFAGDPAVNPNPSWSAYILTTNTWQTTDDPNYNATMTNYIPTAASRTNTTITDNSLETESVYWVKIRHKREYDAEQAGHTVSSVHYYDEDGSTATHTSAAPGNIIYYGYGNPATPTTAVPYTTTGASPYAPVEIITAYGHSGRSVKVLEIEVVRAPGPPIPAAVYSKSNFNGNGSAMTISGHDNCGIAPSIGSVYTMAPGTSTLSGSPTLLGSPSTPQSGPIDIDIASYIDSLKGGAIVITTDQNGTNFGSPSNYVTVYSDTSNPLNAGGLKIQNGIGYGLLLVQGDLEMGGGFVWNGLILVTGNVAFNGGGSGTNVRGAILGNSFQSVNGAVDMRYDSCMLKNSLAYKLRSILSWQEVY